MKAEVFIQKAAQLGEGPIWDYSRRVLFWVDILNHVIYSEGEDGEAVFKTDGDVTSISPTEGGELLATVNLSIYKIDMHKQRALKITSLADEPKTNRFNDGKCDAYGRYWAGTMDRGEKLPVASLYAFESGVIRKELAGLTISNGLGWSPDNRFMYLIDTPTRKVWKFSFDASEGHISNRQVAAEFGNLPGVPDGMTVDSEGMIWAAHWGGGMVSRWNPHNGELLEKVTLPAKNVTSLTFGGPNLKTIFVTTARQGLSKEEITDQPYAGSVFMINSNVAGLPVNFCRI
ncbi:MAG: SMP-30/gluconolactonase/LRE family protein [Nitrososphaerota archaeon]|jgi:sugar lactone lactonase YvrE|nr:SMP-30/gluconolactonase/LRE family protein [Nitrososphaerota archaeon]MDG6926950.1 SMP-30/gluconolactonase/LRE family protein [Nitrososphaerota archaeon]MDG6930498.1 SMP-30/gluconolactonase/LRE family protein [Nitrososphaerota archaeon]MDG6932173.1 SMP-30/gluconolactonase/LRE family protein [Nitrososphaerota archaeon]MDG6935557.1 SMP-30/gluconolactonase/LRE family protein [Nitrososphaerota archaeon]